MPALAPAQLEAHLAGALAPLYVLHGDAALLTEEAADQIRAAARRQGIGEREILFAGATYKWERLAAATGNLSLFGARKLVDLRIPGGKPGREGGEALQRLAASVGSDGDCVLVTLPALDWTQRKAAWFLALSSAAVVLEHNTPPPERLPAWIAGRLRRQSQQADEAALGFIAEHVEGNLLAAHQEIAKLGLLYPAGQLSLEQVREAVLNVARYDVDGLRLAMLDGDAGRCARLLEGLRGEGEAPPLILWALASEIRVLLAVQEALGRGETLAGALKAQRVFDPRRRQALERAIRRSARENLRAGLLQAAKVDRIIKGIAPGDPWDELLQLTLRLRER